MMNRILLLIAFYFAFVYCDKTCQDTNAELECLNDDSYLVCIYDYDTESYPNQTKVQCPSGTKCVCMIGEDCPANDMCKVKIEPKPFVDTGMLTWTKISTYDCSGCWEDPPTTMVRGFSYKLKNGRMFKETIRVISNREELKTQVLYLPTDNNGFLKYEWETSSPCKKSQVSQSDQLVFKDVNGFRMKSSDGRKQHWWKIYNTWGNAQEENWHFHLKEHKGKSLPVSYHYDFSQDGLGDGESHWDNFSFTYYEKMSAIKDIEQREQELIQKCEM